MQFQFRPIERWPRAETRSPRRSQFKAKYAETLELLFRELAFLQARDLVIQAYVTENQIRNDGLLYASARPRQPGIILSFTSKHGPLSYPCDRFDDWQDNLRAIALSLEALRKIDRYGVTAQAEQYTGWKKLGDGDSVPQFSDAATAWNYLCEQAGMPSARQDDLKAVWAIAVKKWHPDRNPNGERIFRAMVAAKRILDQNGFK